jgi:hypothetical protein
MIHCFEEYLNGRGCRPWTWKASHLRPRMILQNKQWCISDYTCDSWVGENRKFSPLQLTNFPSTHSLPTTTTKMLSPIVVVALLLLAVGSNAKLIRGTSLEHTDERNLGTCLCSILCQQCELQGSDMSSCQTTCAIANEPDCSDLCNDYIKGIGIRDDVNTQPPLPDDSTEAPAPTPSTGTCYCVDLCESCAGRNTQSCRTVCEFAELPSAECTTQCNAALHRGNL